MTWFLYRTRIESETLVLHPSVHRIATFRHHIALAPLVRYDVGRVLYDARKGAIRVSETRYECDTRIMPWYHINIVVFTTKNTIIFQRYNNIKLIIIFTNVHIQASLSGFFIITQVISSETLVSHPSIHRIAPFQK